MNAVEIKGLNKSFGKRTIIRDFDLTVRQGEFIALMGPSGCGKSTLLNMIGLLEPCDSGTILLGRKKNPKVESSKATNLRRNTINYLFQSYALINDATVMDNLLCGMYFLDISDKEKKKRASSVLKKVGLFELKNEKVKDFICYTKDIVYIEVYVEQHMEMYESQGLSRKDAMKKVAADRGVGKRDIYQALLDGEKS